MSSQEALEELKSRPLAPMEVPGRISALRERMGELCDGIVITNLTNVSYLCGFTGSAGMLYVGQDEALLVTDGRYATQAREEISQVGASVETFIGGGREQFDALSTAGSGSKRIGLEADSVTWALKGRFEEGPFSGSELVAASGLVEAGRRRKDEGELDRMRVAAAIADAALEEVLVWIGSTERSHLTEEAVAARLDHAMRSRGASGSAFETIVASGPNAAKPHHRPGSDQILPGELVVIDFGALYAGYRSDMTRTVCIGQPQGTNAARMLEVVAQSQAAGCAAVREGVPAADVDRTCREMIAAAGWAEQFSHGTGHGVGMDVHEAPWVGVGSTDVLVSSEVVTVEPGVYIPGEGGVRIEDTLVVEVNGAEALTKAPKEVVLA